MCRMWIWILRLPKCQNCERLSSSGMRTNCRIFAKLALELMNCFAVPRNRSDSRCALVRSCSCSNTFCVSGMKKSEGDRLFSSRWGYGTYMRFQKTSTCGTTGFQSALRLPNLQTEAFFVQVTVHIPCGFNTYHSELVRSRNTLLIVRDTKERIVKTLNEMMHTCTM